jgi:hypothetical protein
MNLSKLDLSALSRALDDHDPDNEHYLDLETGSLWTFVFSDSTDETRKRREEILGRPEDAVRRVPSMTTQEAYEEIEDFVDTLSDQDIQDELFRALESRGAIRNFREALIHHPEERLQWSNLRKERSRRRLESFLQSLGITASDIPLGAP